MGEPDELKEKKTGVLRKDKALAGLRERSPLQQEKKWKVRKIGRKRWTQRQYTGGRPAFRNSATF